MKPEYPSPAYKPEYPSPAYKPEYPSPAYKPEYPSPAYKPEYPSPSYKPAYPTKPSYDYDDYTYNDFAHEETSDDKGYVSGSYRTLLPDGRTQIVNYKADDYTGFVADVKEFKRRKDIENERNGGEKIFHRSTFLEWNYDAEIFAFGNRLGEKFNESSLRAALTHKSYIERESARLVSVGIDSSLEMQDNEELALKGGEMISKFVNGYLRAVFRRVPEEFIMAMHNFLTSSSTLETVAKHIGLGDLMLCSDFPCKTTTYVKSFKAVVAALADSTGEERARIFVQDLVVTQLYNQDVNELWNPQNPVENLTAILKREGKGEPEFRLIRQTGANSILAVYNVAVYSDKNFIAESAGESLEVAQELAAREALKTFFHTDDSMRALPFGRQLKNIQSKIAQLENQPNVPLSKWTSAKVTNI
uniref:Large ribosomal subunit protein mL44 n=1 Tax=Ceriodaphnia reticulata TaxID=302197 RepID=A0A4Y7M0I9_9CRUS|nr:EOG090X0DYO [Ceriodaphnia reticulata]SVE73203.1 EOG090X0DYO [Ceriodaphnia reticulata]